MPFSLTLTDHQETGVAGQTKTYTCNFGTADATRIILVEMGCRTGAGTLAVQSVTIGGITATQVPSAANVDGSAIMVDAWYAAVPTGTTGQSVVVNWGNNTDRSAVAIYSIIGGASSPSAAHAVGGTTNTITNTAITVPSGGGAANFFLNRGGTGATAVTWSANATSDYSAGAIGGAGSSDIGASHANTTGSLAFAATCTDNVGSNTGLVSVAWAAASGAPSGTLAVTEAQDVAAFTATYAVSGTLATTEANDVAAFTGNTVISGTLATTEAPDGAAFTATYAVSGTLVATEAPDVAAFTASYAVSGLLATTEAPDIAAFTGSGVAPSGALIVTEAPDVVAFVGTTIVSGTLATVEAPDVLAFTGTVNLPASGILAVLEASDIVVFTGAVLGVPTGTLAVTETPDVAAFTIGFVPPFIRASKSPYPSIYDYDWYDGMPPLRR